MGRLRAELESLGLDVLAKPPTGSLDQDARAEHAVAAIRMLPSRKGVEVWMADETSGRSLLRQVIVDETPGGPDQNLIALQTAELLRTSFFPKSAPPPPVATISHPSPPPVSPAPSLRDSGLQVRVGALYAAGGASSSLQVWFSLQQLWTRHFGVALDVAFPVDRGTVSGPEGSADVGAIIVGGVLLARLPALKQHLFLSSGLGAAFVSVAVKGHPSNQVGEQILGSSPSVSTCLTYLRLDASWRPTSWFGLGVTGVVGTTTGRVHIAFAGNRAADWGVPVLGGLGFAELAWR